MTRVGTYCIFRIFSTHRFLYFQISHNAPLPLPTLATPFRTGPEALQTLFWYIHPSLSRTEGYIFPFIILFFSISDNHGRSPQLFHSCPEISQPVPVARVPDSCMQPFQKVRATGNVSRAKL